MISSDLASILLGWALLLFGVTFVLLTVLAIRDRLRTRLTVQATINATGQDSLDPYCKAAGLKIEAEIVNHLERVRQWMQQNRKILMTGLHLPASFQMSTFEELEDGLDSLARSAPSIVPSSLVEGVRVVPKLFRQRGYRVTSLLEFGPPEFGHRLGLMMQVSRVRGRRQRTQTRLCTFWECEPDTQAPLPERVETLMIPAVGWTVAELTRGLLRSRSRNRVAATIDEDCMSAQARNAVGLVFREASDACRHTEDRATLLQFALQEFGAVPESVREPYCLAQFFLGETARELADLAVPPSDGGTTPLPSPAQQLEREQWLMKARSSYDLALANLPEDLRLAETSLRQWIGVKRAIAGLLSQRQGVRAAAARWAQTQGESLQSDPRNFLSLFHDARFRYSSACMWSLALQAAPDRADELRAWARYALAAALLVDVLEGKPPALWSWAPEDDDLKPLGDDAARDLENAITDLLEEEHVTADVDSVHLVASRISGWPPDRREHRVLTATAP